MRLQSWGREAEREQSGARNKLPTLRICLFVVTSQGFNFQFRREKIIHSNIQFFPPWQRNFQLSPYFRQGGVENNPHLNWYRSFLFPVFVVPLGNFPYVSAEHYRPLEHQKTEESCQVTSWAVSQRDVLEFPEKMGSRAKDRNHLAGGNAN